MNYISSAKKICIGAICVALCCVLPIIFHLFGGGSAFSPLHFPVLFCGIICGPLYGALCGIAGPILSLVISGMPAAPQLISMIPELVVYGIISGVLFKVIRTKHIYINLYLALIPAMLIGRIAGGAVKAFVYLSEAKAYSISMWVSSYLIGTLPGVIAQLIIIPAIVFALIKTGVISYNGELKSNEQK